MDLAKGNSRPLTPNPLTALALLPLTELRCSLQQRGQVKRGDQTHRFGFFPSAVICSTLNSLETFCRLVSEHSCESSIAFSSSNDDEPPTILRQRTRRPSFHPYLGSGGKSNWEVEWMTWKRGSFSPEQFPYPYLIASRESILGFEMPSEQAR